MARLSSVSRLLIVVAILLGFVPPGRAQVPTSEPILECHNFARAPYLCDAVGGCDRDRKLARIRLDGAFRCVSHLLDCDLQARTGAPQADSCPERADSRCAAAQAAENGFLALGYVYQRDQLVLHCDPIDFQDEFLGGAPLGLGFSVDGPICTSLGAPLQTLPDYITCSDIHHTRAHGQILSLMVPRSRELLEASGWCSLFPEEGVSPIACNAGLASTSPVTGVPTAPPNKIRKCSKRFNRSYRNVLNRHLNLLERCAEGYLTCNLKEAHGDISGSALDTCITRARNKCERMQAARDRRVPRYVQGIERSCSDLTFDDLTDILGFGDLADDCSANTIGEVAQCGADRIACLAWDIIRSVETRVTVDVPPEFLTDYLTCGS